MALPLAKDGTADPSVLDPVIGEVGRQMKAEGIQPPDIATMGVGPARAMTARVAEFWNREPPEVASVDTVSIEGPYGAIPVRIYRPEGAEAGKPLPVLLWCHGGGFGHGTLDSLDRFKRLVARDAGVIVVGYEYQLSPEAKFPVAHEETVAVYRHLLTAAGALGLDPQRIVIGGDSAGGNLVLGLALSIRALGVTAPKRVIPVYPMLRYEFDTESHQLYGQGAFGLTTQRLRNFWDAYLPSKDVVDNWRVCPLEADFAGCPPMSVFAAGCDALFDDTMALVDQLKAEKVEYTFTLYGRMPHGFIQMNRLVDDARDFAAEIVRLMRAL